MPVGQYVYSKAGKAHSVIDRNASDARVQIEIPRGCDAIRGLLVAVVSQDRTYHVPDRRHLRDAYDVLEATPRGCEERRRGEVMAVIGGETQCTCLREKELVREG
jgi:hypothetical protein